MLSTLAISQRPLSQRPIAVTPTDLPTDDRPGDDGAARRRQTGVWVGALGVTLLAGWLTVTGAETLTASHELIRSLWVAQTRMIGPALVVVVAAIFLAERRWPAVPRPALSRAHVVDAGYLLLVAVVGPLVTLLNTGFAIAVARHARFLMLGRLPLVPQVLVAAVIVIGIDAMNWVAHVANHRSAPLWRFHALHHSQEEMSVFTTFRTHPLAHASYLPALLPALVLEASGSVPAAVLIAYGCFVTLPHANLRWSFGPLNGIIVSPAYHRLHHARDPVDGRTAVNFGFVLVCWDRMAGCAVRPSGTEPVATGIADRSVPLEQAAPRSQVGCVIIQQLLQPFRLKPATDGRQ